MQSQPLIRPGERPLSAPDRLSCAIQVYWMSVSDAHPPFEGGLTVQAATLAAFQPQGVSSSRRLWRWPLTRRVMTSVR